MLIMGITGRERRSFDYDFSSTWQCTAKPRNKSQDELVCLSTLCYHGDCRIEKIGDSKTGPWLHYGLCECDAGWTDGRQNKRCSQCCDLPCLNGGRCAINYPTVLPFCSCIPLNFTARSYTGKLCEIEVTEQTTHTARTELTYHGTESMKGALVTGGVLLGVLVFVAMVAALLWILYMRRCTWITLAVDRVKVCKAVSNDTEQRIESHLRQSSRVLLVLSPTFVKHTWPTLERACSGRPATEFLCLINQPVEDSETQPSESLKEIMDNSTCVKCYEYMEKEEMWSELKLALPKKAKTLVH